MANYLAQCKHRVTSDQGICPVCRTKIERIWNVDELGMNNATKLADSWNANIKPKDCLEQRIIPYGRDECIYSLCANWDDEHPNANENERMDAFKNIISNTYREEYIRCVEKDYHKYYGLLNAAYSTKGGCVKPW